MMRHFHIWKIVSQETQPSAWEQMNQHTYVQKLDRADATLFAKPVIVTYKCAVCGSQKVERV